VLQSYKQPCAFLPLHLSLAHPDQVFFGRCYKSARPLLRLPATLLCGLLIRLTACFLGRLTAACLSALLRLPRLLVCTLLIGLTACFLGRLAAACLSAFLWLPSLLLCGLLIRIAACFLGRLAAACLSALQRLLSPLICGSLLLADLCGLLGLTKPASLDSCSSKTPYFIAGLLKYLWLTKIQFSKASLPRVKRAFLKKKI